MTDLPQTSAELHLIGALLEVWEDMEPGFSEAFFEKLNDRVALDAVIRLREPKETQEVIIARARARNWAAVMTINRMADRRRSRPRKRRRA